MLKKRDILKMPFVNLRDHGDVLNQMFELENEEWRKAISKYGAESILLVSSKGRIVRLPFNSRPCPGIAWKIQIKKVQGQKYGHVNVSWTRTEYKPDKNIRQKLKRDYVHQIVARTFLGAPPEGNELVRHRNGDPKDNRVENLIWGNRYTNVQDKLSDPDSRSVYPSGLFIGAALQRRISAAIKGEIDPIEVLIQIQDGIRQDAKK